MLKFLGRGEPGQLTAVRRGGLGQQALDVCLDGAR